MPVNPNVLFDAGAVLTADQQNRLPFGVCASSSSSTTYVLTTSAAISTGMTATFTAIANRLYKVTYFEPQANTSTVLSSYTQLSIRLTNAAGTVLNTAIVQTSAAVAVNGSPTVLHVAAFTAGSVTVVGCSVANSVTGAPQLTRSATAPARLLVEDIGPF